MKSTFDETCDKLDNAFSISLYPKWFRRIFVILIPIMGPLWFITYLLTLIITGLVIGVSSALKELWQENRYDD